MFCYNFYGYVWFLMDIHAWTCYGFSIHGRPGLSPFSVRVTFSERSQVDFCEEIVDFDDKERDNG